MSKGNFAHLLGRKPRADDGGDGGGDGSGLAEREKGVAEREQTVKDREDAVTEREQDVAEREGDCAERESDLAKAEDEEDEENEPADDNGGGNNDDDDEEGDGEMKKAAKAGFSRALAIARRRGRRAERKRCAAIFASPEAKVRVALACVLAFNSGIKAPAAVATLKASPRDGALSRLDPHATRVPSADPLPAHAAGGPAAIAASWAKAFAPFMPKR